MLQTTLTLFLFMISNFINGEPHGFCTYDPPLSYHPTQSKPQTPNFESLHHSYCSPDYYDTEPPASTAWKFKGRIEAGEFKGEVLHVTRDT